MAITKKILKDWLNTREEILNKLKRISGLPSIHELGATIEGIEFDTDVDDIDYIILVTSAWICGEYEEYKLRIRLDQLYQPISFFRNKFAEEIKLAEMENKEWEDRMKERKRKQEFETLKQLQKKYNYV